MALSGLSHGLHHGETAHGAHTAGSASHQSHDPGHPGHPTAPHETHVWSLSAFPSPRVLFSILVGLGATGLLLRPVLEGWGLAVLACLGGGAFEHYLVRPLWNLTAQFASRPARTLESMVLEEARAVMRFNAQGEGLIALELEGQVVQVLGRLCAEERAAGIRVQAGDRLRIEAVDSARNRCVVSRLGV